MFDQTDDKWRRKDSFREVGTGIVLFKGAEQPVKKLFSNKSYGDFVLEMKTLNAKQPDTVLAMKWVATSVVPYEQLKAISCNQSPCKDTCIQPGCICNPNAGVCR